MKDKMLYFLITEISVARDSNRKMNVNFPIEIVFVICKENDVEDINTISNFYQFKNIFPFQSMGPEAMAQIILNQCKSFPGEKAIFIDHDILPREKYLHLYYLLSQNSSQIKAHIYFIDFHEDQEEKDFIEIKIENNDPILFDKLQSFDDVLKENICTQESTP
jgi:hypothetical protein